MNELSRIRYQARRRLRRADDLFVYDLVNSHRWFVTPGQVLTSEVNDHPRSGWLGFPAMGRKNKKHVSAWVVTGCIAPGFKQPINLDLLFEQIAKQITDLMQSENCCVFLYDPDPNQLWSIASLGHHRNSIRISAQCSITGRIFENQLPKIINPPYKDLKKKWLNI